MDTAVLISLISFLGMLINSFMTHRNNKKLNNSQTVRNDSESINLQINSASKIIQDLRIELDRQSKQLDQLKEEVTELKSQERVHLVEKIRLEEKIQALVDENKTLKTQVESNKRSYTEKIERLNVKIKNLSTELESYSRTK
jgi:chromosome segregation ATPase